MRRVIAGLAMVAGLLAVAACGPNTDQKDWSKYSSGLSIESSQQSIR
jgi:hypothetical protein